MQNVDVLLERLTTGIYLLREYSADFGFDIDVDNFEILLFNAHDALMTDSALYQKSGLEIFSQTHSLDQFNAIRTDIGDALQKLYKKIDQQRKSRSLPE